MSAEATARVLGQAFRSGSWWRSRCPVHQGGSASLALRDGERGLIVHCHAGCLARDIYDELRRLDLLDEAIGTIGAIGTGDARRDEDDRHRVQRIANAMDIWGQTHQSRGTIVERYWRSRGLTIPVPPTIRMAGLMWHRESGEKRPAMVALVEHVEHGRIGVHCTYLAVDGSMKATIDPDRKCFGPIGGGAVRLGPVRLDEWLVIGEGIETTASAMQLWNLRCGWAALSEGGIRKLALPPEAQSIIIAADHDASGVGQAAARDAAWLWQNEGRTVRVALPPQVGIDFNNILKGAY